MCALLQIHSCDSQTGTNNLYGLSVNYLFEHIFSLLSFNLYMLYVYAVQW